MNLYNKHSEPKSLHKHDEAHETIPKIIASEFMKGKTLTPRQVESLAGDRKTVNWLLRQSNRVERAKLSYKQIEPAIAVDAFNAYRYSRHIIVKRFPAGEKAIADNPTMAPIYADDFFRGKRWEAAEDVISKSAEHAYTYAMENLNGHPFQKGEKAIANSAHYAALYAMKVIEGRFPAGEKVIAMSAYDAIKYAEHVIKDRWLPGEKSISQSPPVKARYNRLIRQRFGRKHRI